MLKKFSFSMLLIFTFILTISVLKANACGISDEIIIEGQSSWQVQAFEGFTENYKVTGTHERVVCGDDLKIENACELKSTYMDFVGIGGSTIAEATLCRTGNHIGGEGIFESNTYLNVVIPLPFWCSHIQVCGSSMSYTNVYAH